jgi:nucleotidyltransferase/DNA polymerase involved in DNA repair
LAALAPATDGRLYGTFQPAASWATLVAQARQVLATLRASDLPCAAGLARGHFAAAYAATLAASGTLHIFPPGSEATALAPLPLTRLPDVSPQFLREFQQLRLFTLGDLAACPTPLLRAVFGPAVLRLQALARGEEPGAGIESSLTAQALTATRSVPPGATPADTTKLLAALAGDLAATLGGARRAATALTLSVGFAVGPPLHKTARLPAPTTDASILQTAVAPLLVALLRARRSRPAWIALAAPRTCDAVYQPPLPEPAVAADPARRVQAVLADLHARFGPDVIQLGATRVPSSPLPHAVKRAAAGSPLRQVAHALHPSTHP